MAKEVANAIWKHAVLRGAVNSGKALELYRVLKMLLGDVVIIESREKYIDEAMRIVPENRITIYDALYIAQALSKGNLLR